MNEVHTPLGTIVGDIVQWQLVGTRTGVVRRVGTAEESLLIDQLLEREPGESMREFGPALYVQCASAACTSCKGGWRSDWLHTVNECQVRIVDGLTPAVQVALWEDDTE